MNIVLSIIALIVMFAFLYVSLISYRKQFKPEDYRKHIKTKLILIAVIIVLEVFSLVLKVLAGKGFSDYLLEILLIFLWTYNGIIHLKILK